MFDNEKQDEDLRDSPNYRIGENGTVPLEADLKAFEAKLGSLQPSAEGLDRRWRFLLAQEAAFNCHLPDDELSGAGQLICSRCGGSMAKGQSDKRRWAWPAAFSGMTVAAASLLVALIFRPGPQTAMMVDQLNISPSLASVVEQRTDSASGSAKEIFAQRQFIPGELEAPYLNLRDQVIRYGVESWKSPASAIATIKSAVEKPQNCREQLDRLLKQEGWNGS